MGEIRPTYGEYLAKPNNAGYLRKWLPKHPTASKDGTIYIHRQVWYDAHGAIPKGLHIHHIDGNKTNNDLNNLEMHSNSSHQLVHQETGSKVKNQYGVFTVKPVAERASTKWPDSQS